MPKDDSLKTKRLAASRKQIEWLRNIFKTERIMCVAQNYSKDDYNTTGSIEYIKFDNAIGPGAARNELLKRFYNSDYDYLLMLDDDTVSYNYYKSEDFLIDVAKNPEKFNGLEAIGAFEPEYLPYKKMNFTDRNTLTHYKFTPRQLNTGCAMGFLKNIKKYYNKEIYFNNLNPNKLEGNEDIDFLLRWLLAGFNWTIMNTWIRKSLAWKESSIFGSDAEYHKQTLIKNLEAICERFSKYGLKKVNGKITWRNFNKMYNRTSKVLYIKRRHKIEFTEKETPKGMKIEGRLF